MSYKDSVFAVFDYLHENSWPIFMGNDFWHTANTLDTCVDFVVEGIAAWKDLGDRPQQLQQMILASYTWFGDVYQQQNGQGQQSPDVWWDDYGWWGITFAKIHQHFETIFPEGSSAITADDCLDVACKCWHVLDSYSGDVNDKVQSPQKGPIAGGVWNHPPSDNGVQNTVTNGLFLVLSGCLFEAKGEAGYLEGMAEEYLWFMDWFPNCLLNGQECPPPGPQQGLFRCLPNDAGGVCALVYERPVDPANAQYNQGNPPFCDGQLWTGDQGLLACGLAMVLDQSEAITKLDIIRNNDPSFPYLAGTMYAVLQLGIPALFDTTSVLHEAPLNGEFGVDYAPDYATGKGVLMRYFEYLQLKDNGTHVTASAKAVVASGAKVGFQWNMRTDSEIGTNEAQVTSSDKNFAPSVQSAGLDALNAAIRYLGQ
jgi:hypothetical protein